MRTSRAQRPVVGVDIDGTLGDYHLHFQRFAEAYVGRDLGPGPHVYDLDHVYGSELLHVLPKYDGSMPFHKWLGIGKATYREAKLAYRRGGLKRSVPVFPHARELTRNLRRSGVELWLCTTRPYLSQDNIDRDTVHWCRRNGIQFDELMWSPRKYWVLRREAGERVVAVLEDLPSLCSQADQARIPAVFMIDRPYNQGEDYPRVFDLKHAEERILHAVAKWRSR